MLVGVALRRARADARAARHAGAALAASRSSRSGSLLVLAALVSPIDALGEERFSFHMLQHVLLGDLAPLALLAGLTGPLLRPLLALRPFDRAARARPSARRAAALGAEPLVWHLPFPYEAALRHDPVHALEHISSSPPGC